ncbi:MAG: Lrp/AsnC ligand binding domain-containing protein [Candidatus Bathyarchaeia archaeon]
MARVAVPELHALEDFLSEKIRKVPSIILTSTMVIAQECKQKQTKK